MFSLWPSALQGVLFSDLANAPAADVQTSPILEKLPSLSLKRWKQVESQHSAMSNIFCIFVEDFVWC